MSKTIASETAGRVGPWVQTHSKGRVYLEHPRASDFQLNDIAHALSNICRFNGHVIMFYSVAQHSVLVSYVVEKLAKERGHPATVVSELALAGLLHDAAEAFIGDMVLPLKRQMPEFQRVDKILSAAIARRFCVLDSVMNHAIVKEADRVLLVTEARDLMDTDATLEWNGFADVTPLFSHISPHPSSEARLEFIDRFNSLTR